MTIVLLFILILVKYGKLTPLKPAFSLQDLPSTFLRHSFRGGPHTPGQRLRDLLAGHGDRICHHEDTCALCAAGSCSVGIAWALNLRRVNSENPAGSIFLGQSQGEGHGCLLQTAEQLALLGLASAKSHWHAPSWPASFPYVRPMICPLQ